MPSALGCAPAVVGLRAAVAQGAESAPGAAAVDPPTLRVPHRPSSACARVAGGDAAAPQALPLASSGRRRNPMGDRP